MSADSHNMNATTRPARFTASELTPTTWTDFEKLFAKHNGVWGGCWCMYYHGQGTFLLGGRVRANQNKRMKRSLVANGQSHGIIVYSNGSPVGWVQYGPRQELPRIDGSRTYSKLELETGKERLWRITCFFIDRDSRGIGVASFALKNALSSIRKEGGGIVEAYPLENVDIVPRKTSKGKASFLYSGTLSMFEKLGFKVVARLGKSRRLVRKTIS